jgi:hypothetical protein
MSLSQSEIIQLFVNLVTIIGIVAAIFFSINQSRATAKQLRAQSFLQLYDYNAKAYTDDGMDGIELLAKLPTYTSYDDFVTSESLAKRKAIYNTVAFLNFIAILAEGGYLNMQDAWNIYFWSYRLSYKKLFPWWLKEQHKYHPHAFAGFERACLTAGNIPEEQINTFDRGRISRYVSLYAPTANLSQQMLREKFQKALEEQISMTREYHRP